MVDSTSSASVPTIQPWENSSSPYYLFNSDNLGVSLVVQHLTKENYNTWSSAIFIALDAKTKIGFIDGSIPKPQSIDHPCYAAWCKCNNTVLAWLFNSISKDLQPSDARHNLLFNYCNLLFLVFLCKKRYFRFR